VYYGHVSKDLMCELNARKEQKKGGNFPALPTAWAKVVGKAGLSSPALPALPTALGQAVGKAGLPLKHAPALPTASADTVGKENCWQSWASLPTALSNGFANSFDRCYWQSCRSLCQPNFANSRRFPVGEGNGIRADGVPPSPTVHMAVGEAFPTGSAFLLAKSSFPSLKTPTVLSQQELENPVGKAFANILALLAKHAFPVVHPEQPLSVYV
jgi:hypothetical protein